VCFGVFVALKVTSLRKSKWCEMQMIK